MEFGPVVQTSQSVVQYQDHPTDRLVVQRPGLPEVQLIVHEYNPTRGIYEWNLIAQDMNIRVRMTAGLAQDTVILKGQYLSPQFSGFPLNIDVVLGIQSYSEISGTAGTHTIRDTSISGNIVGGADFELLVQARQRFELVAGSGNSSSANTNENWNESRLKAGGHTYQWIGVKKQRTWTYGLESQLDTYWNASGVVTRDGNSWGFYSKLMDYSIPGVIDLQFILSMPDGSVTLEKWILRN